MSNVESGNILFHTTALLEQEHMDAPEVKLGDICVLFQPQYQINVCFHFD